MQPKGRVIETRPFIYPPISPLVFFRENDIVPPVNTVVVRSLIENRPGKEERIWLKRGSGK